MEYTYAKDKYTPKFDMTTLALNILDESKADVIINFLREINFIEIADIQSNTSHIKKMRTIPKSVLSPVEAKHFVKFSREELHER